MKIEILGPGCPKCIVTEEIVKRVVNKLGIKAEVEHVYDIEKIIDYGIMMIPAVAINGEVKIEGKIPTEEEIEEIIKNLK